MKGHCKRSPVITDEDFLITERLLLIKKRLCFFFPSDCFKPVYFGVLKSARYKLIFEFTCATFHQNFMLFVMYCFSSMNKGSKPEYLPLCPVLTSEYSLNSYTSVTLNSP